ncbi:MAG: hypothetical protein WDM89_19345 [Rhizomicrobium sp.]
MHIRIATRLHVSLGAIAAILMALVFAPPSNASEGLDACRIVVANDPSISRAEKYLLRNEGGDIARICVDGTGRPTNYAPISPVVEHAGVCSFEILPVSFVDPATNKILDAHPRNTRRQNQVLMAISNDGCPRQDDVRYSGVSGVSEPHFRGVVDFWGHASASRRNFDSVLSGSARQSESYQMLVEALFQSPASVRLTSVQQLPVEFAPSNSKYKVTVQSYDDGQIQWELYVNSTAEGFKITNLYQIEF